VAGVIDRAWSRRGFASPPWFGRTLPPTWLETSVTFRRTTGGADDGAGGWTAGGPVDYLTVMAHAEQRDYTMDGARVLDANTAKLRFWTLYFPLPSNVSLVPVKGDEVRFQDALGTVTTTFVRSVHLPEQLRDHVEVETEDVE
jgi:hypothetical protein